jgi:hypothetical protein
MVQASSVGSFSQFYEFNFTTTSRLLQGLCTNLLVFLILFYFSNFGIFFALMMGHITRRPFNRTRLTSQGVYGYGHEDEVGRPIAAVFKPLARRGDGPIADKNYASDANDGETFGDGPAPEEPVQ